MFPIVRKEKLNAAVTRMDVLAPLTAAKAQPGQFVILRTGEESERIPLTIADSDPERGTVSVIFQIVGAATAELNKKQQGESILDLVGPLGTPSRLKGLDRVCVVGGGVGCAIAMPIAKALHRQGASVTGIIGFRSRELVILEQEFRDCTDVLRIVTDDGSYGQKGNVTVPLREMLEHGADFDEIIAIGPLVMMKFVVITARDYEIPVTVSMNPIMIDGTGMCGGCRLTVSRDGERLVKFACVDGPDFNGYEVDFDEAIERSGMYADFERRAREESCNLLKQGEGGTSHGGCAS